MPTRGEIVGLSVEKPAAGGRMLARLDGQVVLVSGAIPGERVQARIENVRGGVVFARTEKVDEASPDRRPHAADPSCGGTAYAHIAYDRQLALKQDIVADAFARIARLPLDSEVVAHRSAERGYRMRARLHIAGHRVGFYREASHDLCDPMSSGQLHDQVGEVLDAVSAALLDGKVTTALGLDLSENVPASERALVLTLDDRSRKGGRWDAVLRVPATTGAAVIRGGRLLAEHGDLTVTDTLRVPAAPGGHVRLSRHVGTFFQGNRHLLQALVDRVLSAVPEGPMVDLYAGCGLFGVAHAAAGRGPVQLVEVDALSAADLEVNVAPYASAATTIAMTVEHFLGHTPGLAGQTVVVDPPRTGLSRDAGALLADCGASRVVYLSCDVATLARDARRLTDAGYRLGAIELFDLFPVTAHIETLAIFDR
jgi:23S rRNA (uracil1939-C5)-methyltransferase